MLIQLFPEFGNIKFPRIALLTDRFRESELKCKPAGSAPPPNPYPIAKEAIDKDFPPPCPPPPPLNRRQANQALSPRSPNAAPDGLNKPEHIRNLLRLLKLGLVFGLHRLELIPENLVEVLLSRLVPFFLGLEKAAYLP
jgi:hypothetical protein